MICGQSIGSRAVCSSRGTSVVDPGNGLVVGSGFKADLTQRFIDRYSIKLQGEYVQLKITNSQGEIEVHSASIGAGRTHNETRSKS